MEINKQAYQKLIRENEKWLFENTKDCSERKHILMVLWNSVPFYYPDASHSGDAQDAKEPCKCRDYGYGVFPKKYCSRCGHILRL